MKTLFLLPDKSTFLKQFAQNDQLKSQANVLYNKLDDLSMWIVVGAVVVGIALACIYYKPFNETHGRHYKMKYWCFFLIGSIASVFLLTLGAEWAFIDTKIKKGIWELYFCGAVSAAIYSALSYFLTSVVWCNLFPTNAYKLFKIGK